MVRCPAGLRQSGTGFGVERVLKWAPGSDWRQLVDNAGKEATATALSTAPGAWRFPLALRVPKRCRVGLATAVQDAACVRRPSGQMGFRGCVLRDPYCVQGGGRDWVEG
jgi:hypothetical protein